MWVWSNLRSIRNLIHLMLFRCHIAAGRRGRGSFWVLGIEVLNSTLPSGYQDHGTSLKDHEVLTLSRSFGHLDDVWFMTFSHSSNCSWLKVLTVHPFSLAIRARLSSATRTLQGILWTGLSGAKTHTVYSIHHAVLKNLLIRWSWYGQIQISSQVHWPPMR